MNTTRLLPVSPSMHCAGGWGWGLAVSAPGGAWSGGCLLQGGAWSGGCPCLWSGGGVYPSMQWARPHPPPVNRITDTCKNITLPQRLRYGQKQQLAKWLIDWLFISYFPCVFKYVFQFREFVQRLRCEPYVMERGVIIKPFGLSAVEVDPPLMTTETRKKSWALFSQHKPVTLFIILV